MGAALALVLGCTGERSSPDGREAVEPPPVPDSLRGRPLGVRGTEIGWRDRSGGTAGVVVQRKGPGDETWQSVGRRPPGVFEWVDWGLQPESTYAYRIVAVRQGVQSAPTNQVELITEATEIPDPQVKVFDRRGVSPGVTLFNVMDRKQLTSLTSMMAVDEDGQVVWQVERRGLVITETDPLPDGQLLVQYGFSTVRLNRKADLQEGVNRIYNHHDVDVLPWGNLLAITSPSIGPATRWDRPSGHPDPEVRTQERIVEIEPVTQDVVASLAWEDLVPEEDACDLCLGEWLFNHADWLHLNAVDYDLADQAVYVSVRNLNRIYKVSWPEGRVLWVMGDGGDFAEGLFDHQHNPTRLGPGRMLVFDNGLHGDWLGPSRSRVVEIEYDPDLGEARIVWEYSGPPSFYTEVMGDASRLENGNTLVVDSLAGRIVEVSPDGMPVMEIDLPIPYVIYKAHRVKNFP